MSALMPSVPRVDAGAAVSVSAAGRIHLGFLDPSGTLGRRFGSLGLMVDHFQTEVAIASAARDEWHADSAAAAAQLDRAIAHVQRLREQCGRGAPLALRLRSVLPAHAGLGSGTQLALAVGRAFARWQGLDVPTPTLAAWLGRGRRSGIGIAGFDQGGLLVDGGPSADGTPAPLLARVALPEAWRIVVVLDPRLQGLSGAQEAGAIAALPPFAADRGGRVVPPGVDARAARRGRRRVRAVRRWHQSRAGTARGPLRAGARRQPVDQRQRGPAAAMGARAGRRRRQSARAHGARPALRSCRRPRPRSACSTVRAPLA